MSLSKDIALWIKNELKKSGAKGIVLGLSGGIDSAVVAVVSKIAVGDNVLGVIMPCHSDPDDERCARLVAEKFSIKTDKVDLSALYDEFVTIVKTDDKLTLANVKPRLRMVTLYSFANKLNYLVAGTGNKSEATVGYFTKHGDGGVDLLPIGSLLKTEVRALAKELKIPDEIILRHPSAGLWQGQTDEGELGITYENLDKAIIAIETGKKGTVPQEVVDKVKRLYKASEHKRTPIPVFKRTSKKS